MIKRCADSVLLLGKANQNLITLRRDKFLSELNSELPTTFVFTGTIQNYFLGITYPRQLRISQKLIKWRNL